VTWVSSVCFGICVTIVLSVFRRDADPFSPARVFGFVWCLAVGLADLKFSALQHDWNLNGWLLLIIGIGSFLVGTFVSYVLHLDRALIPIRTMRVMLRDEEVREGRLFVLVLVSGAVYCGAFLANYMIRGWLPIFVIGKNISRVEFNVSGLTLFLYSAAFVVFFTMLYHLQVRGRSGRKRLLAVLSVVVVGSYFLLLQRFQIIMAAMLCFILLFYATRNVRLRNMLPLVAAVVGFFYWMSSLRLSHLASAFLYKAGKMRFSADFAFLTEPYMYVVMNLENFARSVNLQEYYTYGYFTFDFVTAIAGLKYWIVEYFNLDRTPFLESGYNTYTAFWWFYSDFGVLGLALIPLVLGFSTGEVYYRMRSAPSIKNVTAYGVMVFVMFISFFVFPMMHLWFMYNMLALYWILRWTMIPRQQSSRLAGASVPS
jgi:oligosaccharide repeat unit polymerase